ncbi:biotin transporter BioY [Romboutsia weinsteinii]|uniref:Biotin transporter n=1 Tax=Romboutsia weinsteinii TaxID=2020949 RepID=A0A371IXL1_9FIRM|nr:biotin transporter BioY [Romboutsia weinsteinii]RDY25225.1 biotin transporter BioY [Romboutsia weinsteinii]
MKLLAKNYLEEEVKRKLSTKDLIMCSIFASIAAILSQISIPLPFTTVPLTMQLFAVALSGLVLGAKRGFISQIIYILIGAVGMPVFAQMTGGLNIMVGPTGGFIIGFPFMVYIIGYFRERFESNIMTVIGLIIGLIIDYLIGTLMFCFITKMTFMQGIMACVAPFVIVDFIKLGLAMVLGNRLIKRVGV